MKEVYVKYVEFLEDEEQKKEIAKAQTKKSLKIEQQIETLEGKKAELQSKLGHGNYVEIDFEEVDEGECLGGTGVKLTGYPVIRKKSGDKAILWDSRHDPNSDRSKKIMYYCGHGNRIPDWLKDLEHEYEQREREKVQAINQEHEQRESTRIKIQDIDSKIEGLERQKKLTPAEVTKIKAGVKSQIASITQKINDFCRKSLSTPEYNQLLTETINGFLQNLDSFLLEHTRNFGDIELAIGRIGREALAKFDSWMMDNYSGSCIVYFLTCDGKTPAYVGISINPKQRYKSHMRNKEKSIICGNYPMRVKRQGLSVHAAHTFEQRYMQEKHLLRRDGESGLNKRNSIDPNRDICPPAVEWAQQYGSQPLPPNRGHAGAHRRNCALHGYEGPDYSSDDEDEPEKRREAIAVALRKADEEKNTQERREQVDQNLPFIIGGTAIVVTTVAAAAAIAACPADAPAVLAITEKVVEQEAKVLLHT